MNHNVFQWTWKQYTFLVFEVFIVCFLVIFYIFRACFKCVWPDRRKSISNDVVLITGGGKGIGRVLAVQMAKYKPRQIILWGRHVTTLNATAKAVRFHDVVCKVMVCDVANMDQVARKALEVRETIGDVTILINNAGVVYGNTILESDPGHIQHTLEVNTLAHFWTIRAFLPAMMARNHGHIVTMNSMLGYMGLAGVADYCASKFAVTGLTEAVHLELMNAGKTGVHMTSVHPYIVNTDMFTGCQTRFPWLFPALDKEYVTRRTVDAILRNQQTLVLPRHMSVFLLVKSILPVPALQVIQKFVGANTSMETFHRRRKSK